MNNNITFITTAVSIYKRRWNQYICTISGLELLLLINYISNNKIGFGEIFIPILKTKIPKDSFSLVFCIIFLVYVLWNIYYTNIIHKFVFKLDACSVDTLSNSPE